MVIWMTGVSGSGKTTIANAFWERCKERIPELVILDGDVVRQVYGDRLGYTEADRFVQIRRIQSLAKWLGGQGLVVVVAALFSHPDLLQWNRENLPGYFEVYLDAPLDLVKKRDPKGIYARVMAGTESNVVGIDIPWHVPQSPDLTLRFEDGATSEDLVEKMIRVLPEIQKKVSV